MYSLKRDDAVLVVVDIQKKLVKIMPEKVYEKILKNNQILIKAAKILNIPVIYTQQYTKGLGETVDELKELLTDEHVEKLTFSCCKEQSFLEKLKSLGRKSVILTGMEAHICVLQTAIDLLENGYNVFTVADAVCSRFKDNWKFGLEYMRDAGAKITVVETVLFQLLERSDAKEFKEVQALIK
ncbi:isochorismatase hydrolase [Deferribacter desulfuricans SSM1]|uniref:Isochorismatase hydrolase n=1 Tax=Deferribacter desulfuricans (strain DSM 14783 / JCM 11476 / NBRC 101012 / SSM1) TaxID=639282 RepID=D3PC35_DEFDS|nr:hydrolase [Deferribacter desulfuricans]BAI80158.1 isochorismatase hydrolase [Deferribacter desulfuricans SSM1]